MSCINLGMKFLALLYTYSCGCYILTLVGDGTATVIFLCSANAITQPAVHNDMTNEGDCLFMYLIYW
jgi:hypothetical protein